MNLSTPLTERALVASWYLTLYNHHSEIWSKSKMSEMDKTYVQKQHPVSLKILMDLPKGVNPETVAKIGEYMPIDLFFDGLLDYVYNDCMRNLLDSVSFASEQIENVDIRHTRESALMELINDNVQSMMEAFRQTLTQMTLYFGNPVGKYIIEAVAYDSSNETLIAKVVLQEAEEPPEVDAGELIEQENEEDDDEGPETEGEETDEDTVEEDDD